MKKTIYSCFIFVLALLSQNGRAQALGLSNSTPLQCLGTLSSATVSVNSTPPGATSFSWTVGSSACAPSYSIVNSNSTALLSFSCCGLYTVTCNAYNGSSVIGTATAICNVVCGPTVTISSANNPMCIGGTSTLTGSGATNYSWITGATTATISVSPTANTCYTLTGTNSSGCAGGAVACVSISPNPTITVSNSSSSGVICAGSPATLNATGAASYTWSSGPTGGSVVVFPASNGCYTVHGSSSAGCTSSATTCFTAVPLPTISITGSGSTVCVGATCTLTPSGASSYTWVPSTSSLSTIVVTPTVNTCYTVTGINGSGCASNAAYCINLVAGPALTISGTNSVCSGASAEFTASGGTTYLWNTSATSPTISVLTTTSTATTITYSVASTGTNGCMGWATHNLYVDPTCNMVWPGDANSDGVVDNTDVFELGLAFSATGTARTPTSNAYSAQYANTWSGTGSSGQNKCHIDCNGDGTVNNDDTLAIYNNYLQTHTFKNSSAASTVGDINIVDPAFSFPGLWNTADVVAGTTLNPLSQVYGLAFDIGFDPSLIEADSIYMVYTPSFLNASSQNVQFKKTLFPASKIAAASVRVNGMNVSGNGKIAELHFKIKPSASGQNMAVSVTNPQKITNTGVKAALVGSTGSVQLHNAVVDPVGIHALSQLENLISLFPNPAKGQVTLQSGITKEVSYSVCDLSGREITKGSFVNSKTIDLGNFENGVYLVKLESGAAAVYKKLIVKN